MRGVYSSWRRIIAGVPQGSILRPILFLLYVNDLINNLDSIARLFADDTTLVACGDSGKECTDNLQSDIEKVLQWADKWKVLLNASKTDCLKICRVVTADRDLHMNNEMLKNVDCHSHLGCY